MKPNFALDFTHDGIRLLFRAAGGWSHVGEVALDDPKMSEHLKALRDVAQELGEGNVTSKLIIPDSQVLYTTLEAPGPDDVAREVQIRAALEGMTPYAVSELVFDWRAEGDVARVAVLAQETMEEAEGFASQFGFNPVSFVARPGSGSFSGEPFFGKTKSAARILGGNERVTPDATPVPRNPRRMDLPAGAETLVAPATTAPTTPELSPAKPTPQAAPSVPDPAPEARSSGQPSLDPFPAEPTVQETPAAPEPTKSAPSTPAPSTPAPPRKPRAPAAAPALAPFPPTPDDPSEISAKSAYKPIQRSQPASDTPSRKAPTPTREAPSATETPAQAAPKVSTPAPAATDDTPAPAFSSRRGAPATSAATAPIAPRPAPSAPVGVTEPRISDIDDSESVPAKGDTAQASKPKPLVIDDTAPPLRGGLSGEAETRRQAMARAISAPPPTPGEEKPGLLSRVSTGISGLSSSAGSRLRRPAKSEAPAPLAPLPSEPLETPAADETTPAVSEPTKAPKAPKAKAETPKRGRKDKAREKELDARSKEAESLTVFGARRNQSTQRGRPRYMGLVLTLVLLLLMAAAALWSTVFLDDEEVTLFNPDPAPAEATGSPEEVTTAEAPSELETPPELEVETGSVLTPEEAEAQYAVTGVYQRAPEPLGEPETARGDDIYVASIDPSVSANDALALPDPGTVAETPSDAPIPPPPPGTSFDLNEDGLVIATPEGAVSPTGVIVIQGRPDVVPAPRPEGIVPETQDDAALALPSETPERSPESRPENLAELNERAQLGGLSRDELAELRPRARPEGLETQAPEETEVAALEDAVEQAVDEAVSDAEETAAAIIENATELAVASSMRPGARPSNFSALVQQAVQQARNEEAIADEAEDNSDGTTVVAAAARSSQPIIPSSASVARTATMKNALPMGRVNLIGIYGSSSSRRALVRMGNGRYVKVSVGDRLDGGQVLAISDSRLIYQKGSRQFALDVLPLG